jgi:phosphoglycolate phosphatase
MSFHAILFDVDGTLLNTLQDLTDSVNAALARFGFPQHEIEAYRYFVGDGSSELARRALPKQYRNTKTIEKIVKATDEEYTKRWADNTVPYEGIPELLDAISNINFKKCILSNKKQSFTELTLAHFLTRWHFDLIIGAQPGLPRKPDPTAALLIARRMNLIPKDFLYLGDTATDMKTAVAAGMYPVGALWGFRTATELRNAGAKVLVPTPAGILSLI